MLFRLPRIDNFSFILGIIFASVAWWVISTLRPALRQIRATAQIKNKERKERARSSNAIEERYRQSVLLQTQALHLASPIFSLDEILVQPRLLAPPPRVEPGEPPYTEDIVDTTLPYLPAWPEMAAIYGASTLTLSEALSGNSDIILVGQAGSGKTVALASFASRLARRESEAGIPPETLPFFVHVADLDLPVNKDNPLKALIDHVSEKASVFDLQRIPGFIQQVFSDGLALVLIDGTDELTPDGLKVAVDFIKAIKKSYPKTRMITTATNEYLDGLVSLNFIPFTLAAWNPDQRKNFYERWGELWVQHVAVESWAQTIEQADPLLLNAWLNAESSCLTPLEITLKAWGVYAGDLRGPSPIDGLEAHIRRITPVNTPREALESLALQATLASDPIFDPHKARQWVKSFEPNEPSEPSEPNEPSEPREPSKSSEPSEPDPIDMREPEKKKAGKSGKIEKQKIPSLGLIAKMAESGLLQQHLHNHMRFVHPIFAGYLAGKLMASYTGALLAQPPWIGKVQAMLYFASGEDATPLSKEFLSQLDQPLARNLFIPARWLRDAPEQALWRRQVMAKLVDLLRQSGQPMGLRGQALAAFVNSRDPGVVILLRQLLLEKNPELLQLAALGVGALKDSKSTDLLIELLKNPIPNVRRAACLALAAINTTAAMDGIASALLHGDEFLRRAAAEAMSTCAGDGQNMLREGAEMKDDLDVRRAAAYGLGRIHQPWAEAILDKLQVEDDQWVVRNAASEMIENRRKPNRHIPKRLPPPSESPWLIAFAGKQGMGISPEKPPTDLLLQALKSENPEEQLASLSYLRMMPVEGVFGALYQAMYGGDSELREAVFLAFSEMAARGVDVPNPIQFGVGY